MAAFVIGDESGEVAESPVLPAGPTVSFELYPPRTEQGVRELDRSLERLVAIHPEFISVTYGASGSTRGVSLSVLRRLLESTAVRPMAHLTCVGSSYAEASRLIREFLDAGVTSFLALRGDPPAGQTEDDSFLGDLRTTAELVQLIHRVQAERAPFSVQEVPGFPGTRRLGPGEKVTIAVAAFPNGHPRSRSVDQDLDTLLAKEAAGANLAITQLVFQAEDYLRFVEKARGAGVTMRILPGIMPILSAPRLRRAAELAGEDVPADFEHALEHAADPTKVGVEQATRLSREILDGGADGLHLYTFNRYEAPLAVLGGVGLLPASAA